MLNSSELRDKILTGISIKYEWNGSLHFALLSLTDSEKTETIYKLDGLLEIGIYDDFKTMYISQVKLLDLGNQVYLSLDPREEHSTEADYKNDNLWFKAKSIDVYTQRT